jgi:KDO2-lipid IV(A) lauroyltransferase
MGSPRPAQNRTGPGGYAAYLALRAAMMAPQIAGPANALELARRLGRTFGGLPLNRKRIARAAESLRFALPGSTDNARRELALESYEHLAMLAVEVAFLPRVLTEDSWTRHVDVGDVGRALDALTGDRPVLLITGHTGNWEVMGYTLALLGVRIHAIYRPLDLKPLDRWVRRTRERRGLQLVDKFGAVHAVPRLLEDKQAVAFVADQNAGDRGVFVPFFGRLTSTYKSIGLMALRHNAVIVCGGAHRVGWDDGSDAHAGTAGAGRRVGANDLRFRVMVDDVFGPEDYLSQPDPLYYLTARYRRSIENLVRVAPSQYLWMHRIWKSRPRHERLDRPFPDSLRRKLGELPWMDDAGVEAIADQSDRDRAFLTERGLDRMP